VQIVFIVINFYPSLLLPSFANDVCHYYNYRSLTICKNNIKIEKRLQYNTIRIWNKIPKKNNHLYIYKKNTYSWNHKKEIYLLWNTYNPCIFPHMFEIHLGFQKKLSSFKIPQHQKKISFPNSFMTNIKKKGSNPQDVPYHTYMDPPHLILNFFTLSCFLIFILKVNLPTHLLK